MKYVSELNEADLIDLVILYTGNSFVRLVEMSRDDDRINLLVEVNIDGKLKEEWYSLYDYSIASWDYEYSNEDDIVIIYREKMLEWFGNQYAIDFLIW